MNQEELDTLVGEDFEDFDNSEIVDEGDILDDKDEIIDEDITDGEEVIEDDEDNEIIDEDIIDDDAFSDVLSSAEENSDENEDDEIIPPPADNKNKVVAQLDEVTKESEEKATQILDIMDEISSNVDKNINSLKETLEFLKHHQTLCEKLHTKFPHIKTFEKELNEIKETIKKVEEIVDRNEITSEKIFTAMDIMQYQDIHRQKIERVINIMRALIKYMNKLFEGSVEDEKRVQSAKHIHGDESSDVLSDEDIEALLDQFGV